MGLWARWRPRGVRKGAYAGGVAVLIAAHNEADVLPRKLDNLLELAKTEPIREIWIGLDGCTDGTGERLQERIQRSEVRGQTGNLQPVTLNLQPAPPISNIQYSISNVQGGGGEKSEVRGQTGNLQPAPAVYLLEFESRRGKAAVLNELMVKAGQPVLAMMDARQRVESGAISRLLENFADEQVGVVSGELVYESAVGAVQKGAESYWGYEKFIRQSESRVWAVPGATGALYAIRKELCKPIPENTLVDDVLIPMRAVVQGYRCLFEPSARVFDLPSARFGQEGVRKRRTLAGIWQLAALEPRFFSFRGNPIAFQWISHKFLRLLTPFFVLAAMGAAGSMECWTDGKWGWAGIIFGLMVGGAMASGLAYWGGKRVQSRFMGLLGAFFGVNWALLQAAWDAAKGQYRIQWRRTD